MLALQEAFMRNSGKTSLIENVLVLALMGILAGAAGGLAIGIVTGRPASTSSTSH
jgi:NhaP-type Na+/H+ or K+/H+ antiporter